MAGLFVVAVLLVAGSGVAQKVDDAAQQRLVAGAGGPVGTRRMSAWLVAGAAAGVVAVPTAVATVVTAQWGESLTRLGRSATELDTGLAAAFNGEMQNLTIWMLASLAVAMFLPLAAACIAGYVQHRRRREAREVFEHDLGSWMAGRSYEETLTLAVEMENVRLVRRLGFAPKVGMDDLDQVVA